MILKELTLQNFRSYGQTPTKIELDRGMLLFEGDVGSGKSSILYAIEFALFGLGELEAKYILRSSASAGRVELEFAVGSEEYRVIRTIERKKIGSTAKASSSSTLQTRGWIQEPGTKKLTEFSPTELKSRILQILNFKEKQSAKASSRIYRYAVFTPQELMKEVLAQRPEERLETLRRAFGVEDYSFAGANTEIVLGQLNKEIEIYSKLSENLPQKETQLQAGRREIASNEERIAQEEQVLKAREKELEELRSTAIQLEAETQKVARLQALIPVLDRNLVQLQRELSEHREDRQRNSQLLKEIEFSERRVVALKGDYEEYLAMREKLRELDDLSVEMHSIEKEISDLKQSIVLKETGLKAELEYKEDQSEKMRSKIVEYQKEIAQGSDLEENVRRLEEEAATLPELQTKIEELQANIGSTTALLSSIKARAEDQRKKIAALDGITNESKCPLCGQALNSEHLKNVDREYQRNMAELEDEKQSLQARLSDLNFEFKTLERKRNEGRKTERQLEGLKHELAGIEQLGVLESNLTKELEELEHSSKSIGTALLEREFAKEAEAALSELVARKDLLSNSLKDYAGLRERYQKLEDSRIAEAYQSAQSTIAKKSMTVEEIARLDSRCRELEEQIKVSASDIKSKKEELEQLEPVMLAYSKVKEDVKRLEGECYELNLGVEVLLERTKKEKEEEKVLSGEVEALRKNAELATRSKGISSWLSGNFLPAIGDIERNVLATINEEFAHIFQRIFSILATEEGDLSVTIDDHFTPVIEQGGYELDVASLSGGERTAVALAYRLALNYMVKRANESLQTNLLILDEPTEGFSKEQIYRFRNALEELACDQVIMVSHERDLEPMAERVFRIEKVDGVSIVMPIVPSSSSSPLS